MNFAIRTASAADVPAMHAVRMRVRENRLWESSSVSIASYLPYIGAGSAWVAEGPSGVVGFAVLDVPAQSVWALFTDPDAEGQGIGRALHADMLSWARARGLPRLTLCTDYGTRAAHFYHWAGWTETGMAEDGQAIFEMRLEV